MRLVVTSRELLRAGQTVISRVSCGSSGVRKIHQGPKALWGAKVPEASIFLVEDEALIRMMLADMVEELGHRVVAEAGNIRDGVALAGTAVFDFAILDINIGGYRSAPSPRSSPSVACRFSLLAATEQLADRKHTVTDRSCRNRY